MKLCKYISVGCIGYSTISMMHTHMIFGWFSGSKDNDTKDNSNKDVRTDTYVWGNGLRTDKSDFLNSYPDYEPVKLDIEYIDSQPSLRKVSFGPGLESGIDNKGNLFIWRMMKQLSLNDDNKDAYKKRNVDMIVSGVDKAGFTQDSCIVLKNDGSVYRIPIDWTRDGDDDIIGYSIDRIKIHKMEGIKDIVDVSYGDDHVLALDRYGSVYCYGDDTLGQCGAGDKGRTTYGPFVDMKNDVFMKIDRLSNIKHISCGSSHSIAVDGNGKAYGWGNNSFYQLSHSEEYKRYSNPLMVSYDPIPISKHIEDNRVVKVSAGRDFTVLVTENQKGETEMYSTGVNRYGQLGIGEYSDCEDMKKVQQLSNLKYQQSISSDIDNVRIDHISCGLDHCMCITNMNIIFEWGANNHGQLGNKKKVNSSNPIILSSFNDKHIIDISCGENSSSTTIEHVE